MTEHFRYYGHTYSCPADTAVRVSDTELALIAGYVQLRREARELTRARTAPRTPRTTTGDRT